jgi:hypothetical protein
VEHKGEAPHFELNETKAYVGVGKDVRRRGPRFNL